MSSASDSLPQAVWRGVFRNDEVNALHAECFEHRLLDDDWWGQVNRHSLGWVTARLGDDLAGFVNIAWDGGVHAFLLDTMVPPAHRRRGIATLVVRTAIDRARASACEWLHVDYEPHLLGFYRDACGIPAIAAGALALK